jgi:ribosomal protein L23
VEEAEVDFLEDVLEMKDQVIQKIGLHLEAETIILEEKENHSQMMTKEQLLLVKMVNFQDQELDISQVNQILELLEKVDSDEIDERESHLVLEAKVHSEEKENHSDLEMNEDFLETELKGNHSETENHLVLEAKVHSEEKENHSETENLLKDQTMISVLKKLFLTESQLGSQEETKISVRSQVSKKEIQLDQKEIFEIELQERNSMINQIKKTPQTLGCFFYLNLFSQFQISSNESGLKVSESLLYSAILNVDVFWNICHTSGTIEATISWFHHFSIDDFNFERFSEAWTLASLSQFMANTGQDIIGA